MLALFFMTAGFTVVACSSSDSDSGQSTGDDTEVLTCDSVEEGQECLQVTGLEPNTTYYWKMVGSDDQGGSLESDVWSFTTGE
jgi:hypothetical protein